MKRICLIIQIAILCWSPAVAGNDKGVDIFCGADLSYKHVNYQHLYDVMLYLTPGAKWNIGQGWQLAGQVGIPIVRDGYDEKYKYITLRNLSLSKQIHFNESQHIKFSGGMFSRHRYGIDVKWMGIVNRWLAFTGQCGYIGKYSTTDTWGFDNVNTLTFLLGAKVYLNPWNTEFGITGGRYINKDYGLEGDVKRHFKHCTISLFGQYHDQKSYVFNGTKFAGGFRVVVLLPSWHWGKGNVHIRPSSNFRITSDQNAERILQKMYYTDPEENEREGWFSRDEVKWGANLMDKGGDGHEQH